MTLTKQVESTKLSIYRKLKPWRDKVSQDLKGDGYTDSLNSTRLASNPGETVEVLGRLKGKKRGQVRDLTLP